MAFTQAQIRAAKESAKKRALLSAAKAVGKKGIQQGLKSAGYMDAIKSFLKTPGSELFGTGGQAAGAASATIGQAIPLAGFLASLAISPPREANVKQRAMQGMAAMTAAIPGIGLPLAAILGLGSMIIPTDKYVHPELYLSGREKVKFDPLKGLVGAEGLVLPNNRIPYEYMRGKEFLGKAEHRPATTSGMQPQDKYKEFAEFKKDPDAYYRKRGGTKIGAKWYNPDTTQEIKGFDWGLRDPYIGEYGTGLDPTEGWAQTTQVGSQGEAVKARKEPIISPKYGTIKYDPDYLSQGGPELYYYGGSGEDSPFDTQYGPVRNALNFVAKSAAATFNDNIMAYVNTLDPDAKKTMMKKLQGHEWIMNFGSGEA